MYNTDKKTLIKLVKQEAKNIKENATPREIKKLNIEWLDPADVEQCIYGQMTGSCYSKRANKLIVKCATKVYKAIGSQPLEDVELNGKPKLVLDRSEEYHSPIEIFIYHHGYEKGSIDREGNIKRLINYLKGVTKTLSLK